jgi:hypothetical protein
MIAATLVVHSRLHLIASAVWFAIFVPYSTFFIEPSIISVVSFAAFADRRLCGQISYLLATTQILCRAVRLSLLQPLALRASIFVWNAISSINFIIFEILCEELFIYLPLH